VHQIPSGSYVDFGGGFDFVAVGAAGFAVAVGAGAAASLVPAGFAAVGSVVEEGAGAWLSLGAAVAVSVVVGATVGLAPMAVVVAVGVAVGSAATVLAFVVVAGFAGSPWLAEDAPLRPRRVAANAIARSPRIAIAT
jgi:hypothetical protein